MKFLIISGLSGAGKSRAADALEDLDYYCVDNLPTALLTKFAELCLAMGGRYERVALVTDVRGQESFNELFEELKKLEQMGIDYQILYMEAADAAIVQRYKESRRPHPLIDECGTIQEAVIRETELLRPVRDRADHIINTTNLSLNMLQHLLLDFFGEDEKKRARPVLNVMSFGFKHGLPFGSGHGVRRALPAEPLLCGGAAPAHRHGHAGQGLCSAQRQGSGVYEASL